MDHWDMNALSHTALAHRIARSILVLVCACLGGGAIQPASATPLPPPDRALVYVPLPSADALDRFEATGLPAFAQEEDAAGAYVLAGADRDGLGRLTAAGLQAPDSRCLIMRGRDLLFRHGSGRPATT